MKTETFEGTIDTYQGKALATPIKYSGSVELFTNKDEAVNATAWPGDSDILEMLNGKRLTAAKAKVYQKETADLKAAYEASPEFKFNNLVKAILASDPSKSQKDAEGIAETLMGGKK